jgi:hemoglobin-like flavoprotein
LDRHDGSKNRMNENFDDLQMSYGRSLRSGPFIARFYTIFMDSHPDVPTLFADTDFSKQHMALRRGISVAIAHASGSGLARRTMNQMACAHARNGHAPVPPALYPYWVESLLTAIAEHDPEYSPQLGMRWRAAMEHTVGHFSRAY